MRRALSLIVGAYVMAALIGLALEKTGVRPCGCAPSCWCKRPGLSLFRWVFPWGHEPVPYGTKERLDI